MSFFEDARAVASFMRRYTYNEGYRYIGIGVDGTLEKMMLCYQYNKWNDSLIVQISVENKFGFDARFDGVGKDHGDIENIQNYLSSKKLTLMRNFTEEDAEHIIMMARLEGRT